MLDGQRVAMTGTGRAASRRRPRLRRGRAHETMMVNLTANSRSEMLDRMEHFAAEVMPLV